MLKSPSKFDVFAQIAAAAQSCILAAVVSCASLAQLVEHALRKRTVVGSIPTGGYISADLCRFIAFARTVGYAG